MEKQFGAINSIIEEQEKQIVKLQAENRELRELLELVTDDLEEEIENRYSVYTLSKGSDNKRKYERDIEPVRKARKALGEGE